MNETIGGNEQQSPEEIFRAQFADAIDKVEEAIEKNPLDPTELETLEQSLHTSYIGYSESVRKTATAVELNDKITHLENLGTKIEEIINFLKLLIINFSTYNKNVIRKRY